MDEAEFLSVLDLFPTVRSASFCLEEDDDNDEREEEEEEQEEDDDDDGEEAEAEAGRQSQSERRSSLTRAQKSMPSSSSSSYFEAAKEWPHQPQDKTRSPEAEDIFWTRLKQTVEQKLSPADSIRFCDAFRKIHQSLVQEVLSSEAVGEILKTWKLSQ